MQIQSLSIAVAAFFLLSLSPNVAAQHEMSPVIKQSPSITLRAETAKYLADADYDYYVIDRNNVLKPTKGYKLFLRKDGSATLAVSVKSMGVAINVGTFLQFFCEGCVEKTCEFVQREEESNVAKGIIRYECVRCHKKGGVISYCRGGFHIRNGGLVR